MSKIRFKLTVVATREYEVNPEHYPEEMRDDPQKMLACDIEGAEQDVFMTLDSSNTKWEPVKGEVIT